MVCVENCNKSRTNMIKSQTKQKIVAIAADELKKIVTNDFSGHGIYS